MNRFSFSKSMLVAFAIAVAGACGAPAFAATIVVLDRSFPPEVKVTGTIFDVDEKLGRARLDVQLYDDTFEPTISSESVAVPGLTFDRESHEVRYASGSSVVTCAQRKRVLWATTYPATGACRITVKSEPRTTEAGSGERALKGWVVELATDTTTKAAAR
jgi:hypothetical protein